MNIKPLSNHILIEPIKEEEKTASGIFLPDTAEKEKQGQGRVVAVGPGKMNLETGQRIQMEIKVGNKVLFKEYGPAKVKVDGKEYLIAEEEDMLAILE